MLQTKSFFFLFFLFLPYSLLKIVMTIELSRTGVILTLLSSFKRCGIVNICVHIRIYVSKRFTFRTTSVSILLFMPCFIVI